MAGLALSPRKLQKRNAKKRFSDDWLVSLPSRSKRPKLHSVENNPNPEPPAIVSQVYLGLNNIENRPNPEPQAIVMQVYQRRKHKSIHNPPSPPEDEQRLNLGTQKTNLGIQKAYPSAHDQKFGSAHMVPFRVGDIVWAKSHSRNDTAWPAIIIDPSLAAPQEVQRPPSADCFCVTFFGPLVGTGGKRESCWVCSEDIFYFFNNQACSDKQNGASDLDMAILEAKRTLQKQSKIDYDYDSNVNAADDHIYGNNGDCSREPDNNVTACASVPTCITVVCFGVDGSYYPKLHEVICLCSTCHGHSDLLSLTKWEAHTGCRQKKWKSSVKLKDSMQSLLSWLQSMADSGVTDLAFQVYSQEQVIKARLQIPFQPVALKWTQEKCAVCRWVEDYDYNQMLVCNRCQIAVHEECYGVRLAETGGSFVCRACEDSNKTRECCLCPVKGGALKPSVILDLWVHVYCAWFTKGVFFQSITKMEPADGIASIEPSRFKQQCVVCKQVHGVCIRCEECETTFHATCALRAGYRMELSTITGQNELKKVSYCAQHRNPTENGRLVIAALEAELLQQEKLRQEEIESSVASDRNDEDVMTPSSLSPEESDSDRPGNEKEEIRLCARACVYSKSFHHKVGNREAVPTTPAGYAQHAWKDILSLRNLPNTPEILSIEERLINLEKTQRLRICFGKSAIHKWGLFARQDIQEGELVMEYRGEIVCRSVADIREKRYNQQGKDCYLFKVSDDIVIDATCKGNIARLINHSCAPNCFARIYPVKRPGGTCIILIAKKNVMAGEELTYDYLFESENRTVPCLCGAPNCRKFIC